MVQEEKNKISKETMIDNIIDNYVHVEKSIVEQLFMKHDLHGSTIGSEREDIWRQIFDMIIPRKFAIEQSIFIIDSSFDPDNPKSGISREIDLVIFDEMYTPYIFRYGRLKFIPIEAVAVVVECKSKNFDIKTVEEWCKRINELSTSNESVARMATSIIIGENEVKKSSATQTSTRPIRIFCSMSKNSEVNKIKKHFDFVLTAVDTNKNSQGPSIGEKGLKIEVADELTTLDIWQNALNHNKDNKKYYSDLENIELKNYTVKRNDKEISLLSFNFKLNQLLMLINNPILFPHMAYVKMFNKE